MTRARLRDVIDIRAWLAEDPESNNDARATRDRGLLGDALPEGEVQRVLTWWSALSESNLRDAGDGTGLRIEELQGLASVALAAGGTLLGITFTTVALTFDGDKPVNVIALLGVLVALPGLMLVISLALLLLPASRTRPGLIGAINPGRWVGAWLDRAAGSAVFVAFSRGASSRYARWQLLAFSQYFALGFFAGAVLTLLALVAFTDLAFGWSTTLDIAPTTVHSLVSSLSLPWSGWLTVAVPDIELVTMSRYFRLEAAAAEPLDAARLGAWWPFVLMCLIVWGALPRLVTLVLARIQSRPALEALLLDDSNVIALLDRLTPAPVAFDREQGSDAATEPPPIPRASEPADGRSAALAWNDAIGDATAAAWLEARYGATGVVLQRLHTSSTVGERQEALSALAEAGAARQVVFCKGWEPPLLELDDLLEELRALISEQAVIVLAPLTQDGEIVHGEQRQVWEGAAARRGDPRTIIAQGGRP